MTTWSAYVNLSTVLYSTVAQRCSQQEFNISEKKESSALSFISWGHTGIDQYVRFHSYRVIRKSLKRVLVIDIMPKSTNQKSSMKPLGQHNNTVNVLTRIQQEKIESKESQVTNSMMKFLSLFLLCVVCVNGDIFHVSTGSILHFTTDRNLNPVLTRKLLSWT